MDIYNLSDKNLDKAFKQAYEAVSNTDYKFEQDTLLYFYGYYKHATKEFTNNSLHRESSDGEKSYCVVQAECIGTVQSKAPNGNVVKKLQLSLLPLARQAQLRPLLNFFLTRFLWAFELICRC